MAKIAILVVIIYLSGIVLAFLNGAHWAFYLYQSVYFLNPENRWWSNSLPSISYSFITVVLLFSTYLLNYKKYTLNKLHKLPQFKWMLMLMFFYLLTYFYAINQQLHLQAAIEFIKMILVLSIAYKVLDSTIKLEWALLAYIIGSGYIGYEAFVTGRNSGDRVEGIGLIDAPEANGTAAAIVASVPLIIYFLWWGDRKIKLVVLVMALFIANALVLINSRGAIIGAFIGVSYFMWAMFFAEFKFNNQKKIAFALVMLGLAGIFYIADDSFLDRMHTLTNTADDRASGSHRTRMWTATFDILEDHPFGVGASGFEILSPYYVPEELFFNNQKMKAVHSIWFQALGEVGWHGFISFFLIISTSYLSLKHVKKKCIAEEDYRNFYLSHAVQSAFVTVLVTSSFINQFRVQIVYWMILFSACLYSIIVINSDTSYKQNN